MKQKRSLSTFGIIAFIALMSIPFSLCCMIPNSTSTNYPPNYQKSVLKKNSVVKMNIDIDIKICTIFDVASDNPKEKPKPICKEAKMQSSGTGTVYARDETGSLILTANHVCNLSMIDRIPPFFRMERLFIAVTAQDMSGKEYRTQIVSTDEKEDMCSVKAIGLFAPTIPISSIEPESGDRVLNMSFPRGIYSPNMALMFEGFYSGPFELKNNIYAAYSIFAAGGSSGSAILNVRGEIVGMIHSGLNTMEHFALSPQFKILHKFLMESIEKNNNS